MSGPVLKLSAWGAQFCMIKLSVYHICKWLNDVETTKPKPKKTKRTKTRQKRFPKSPFDFPNRLWESLVLASELKPKPNGPI
jgi:hypothetical protein